MRHAAAARSVASVAVALLLAACSVGHGPAQPAPGPAPGPATGAPGRSTPGPPPPSTSLGTAAERPARPNVLLVETDDMRADELRWMPLTQRLIGDAGLTFTNSFAPDPLCCPSRASLLTGQYSHNHGVMSHEEPYGFGAFDDSDTLATRLQDAGYRTALVGKYLNGYGIQPTYAGEPSLTYVPPGWTEWWAGSDKRWEPGDALQGGTYSYFHLTSNVNGRLRSWPGEYSTEVTARQTRQLLGRFGRQARDDDRPWFVWWNPIAPHHGGPTEPDDPGTVPRADGFPVPWVTPARPDWVKGRFDAEIQRGLGVPAPAAAASEPEDNRDKPTYLRGLPDLTDAEQDALTAVSRQRAESLHVLDLEVARTLAALEETGQLERTLVVFTSDNGYYLGEHLKRQGKINLHEPSVRVPLLVAGPGIPRGLRHDPATTIDLARTIASWASVDLAAPDGVDLSGVIDGGDRGWHRPVVLEGLMPEPQYLRARERASWSLEADTAGIRLGRWKYVRYATGESELYDLRSDPLELESISGAAGGMRARLRSLWDQYVACAGDACRRPLPADLRLGAAANADLTTMQQERHRNRFR